MNLDGALIGRHEEAALIAAVVVGLLGALSLLALWLARRGRTLPRWAGAAAVALSLAGSGLMAWTGLFGGQIRRTERRPGFVTPPSATNTTTWWRLRSRLARAD